MYNYAQINDYLIVVAVSSLSGEVLDAHMIPIESVDDKLLGKTYDRETGEFYDN